MKVSSWVRNQNCATAQQLTTIHGTKKPMHARFMIAVDRNKVAAGPSHSMIKSARLNILSRHAGLAVRDQLTQGQYVQNGHGQCIWLINLHVTTHMQVHHPKLARATPKSGSPSTQLKGPHRKVEVHDPNSKGHTEAWESITQTQRATPKSGSPSTQLKGPHRSVGVHHPNSWDHTEAWESITQTQRATLKSGGPSTQLQGPHPSVGVHHPNSWDHTKAWESITPTHGATLKRGSPSP